MASESTCSEPARVLHTPYRPPRHTSDDIPTQKQIILPPILPLLFAISVVRLIFVLVKGFFKCFVTTSSRSSSSGSGSSSYGYGTDRDNVVTSWNGTTEPSTRRSKSRLRSLVQKRQWRMVIDRSFSHPEELELVDAHGQTPLLAACRLDAPENVAMALLSSYRLSASMREGNGEFDGQEGDGSAPLHYGCTNGYSVEVIQALLESSPASTSWMDGQGRTPLHCACRSRCSSHVLRLLLRANPEAAMIPDKFNFLPFHLLVTKYDSSSWRLVTTLSNLELHGSLLRKEDSKDDIWEKVILVVLATYHGTVPPTLLSQAPLAQLEPEQRNNNWSWSRQVNNRWMIVHACAGLETCPVSLLKQAIKRYPHQMFETDANGNLPLHLAASRGPFPNERNHLRTSEKVMEALLDDSNNVVGASSVPNRIGRLALSIALERGMTWRGGIRILLYSETRVLMTKDVTTHLYPFMLAAAEASHGDDDDDDEVLVVTKVDRWVEKKSMMKVDAAVRSGKGRYGVDRRVDLNKVATVFELLLEEPSLCALGIRR